MRGARDMGSRDKVQTMPHQPLLSSLVIRPTDTGGGAGGGSDYEPGEVRRDPPPTYARSDRYDAHGYRMRAVSVSPVRRRDGHHCFSPGIEHSGVAPRSRGFGNGREPGRNRDFSPPYGRGKDSRFIDRGYDRSACGPGPFRNEGLPRNNPNVRPREGDWICSDPSCKNLNFARREQCNNCNRPRYGSPRKGYHPVPPAFPPRQRLPLDQSPPGRFMNGGYRSPPRGWRPPPVRHEGRFPEDGYNRDRDRHRFESRPVPPVEWGHRQRGGRDYDYFNDKRGYGGRRALSPPPAPPLAHAPRGGWAPLPAQARERSRSPPFRGGPPPRDYQRDVHMSRGRDDRRGRDAF